MELFWSKLRWDWLRMSLLLLSFALLPRMAAWPQAVLPGVTQSPPSVQAEAPKDSLGRTTPRSAVLGFLAAAKKKNYDVAAEYLDTRLKGEAAAKLAHQLSVVLDQRLPARLNELSDKPEGSSADTMNPDRDVIGTITSDIGNLDIVLERLDRGKYGSVWLFSSQTLDSIPDIYYELDVVSVESHLPQFLVTTRVVGIPLFHLLAVFVGLPLLYFLATLVDRFASPMAGWLRRRLAKKANLPNPQVLPRPVRLLLIAVTIRWLLTKLGLPLLARQFWSSVSAVMAVGAVVWMLLLLNGRVERYVLRQLRKRNLAGTGSVLRLARRVVDVLFIFAGVIGVLYYFGVSPTAALAGLGVGGIAVALAAQKTLENVIGGASLIFDQVVRTGDFLKAGDVVGTVEEVGLRSIRIRTLDRTVVSIPNGQLAIMNLETISVRDKYWFHPLIGLRYGTPAANIRSVVDNIRARLMQHSSIEPGSVRTRFVGFGSSSLNVDIFAYVYAREWNHFLEIQEELLFSIMDIIRDAATQIALPSQATYFAAKSPADWIVLPDILRSVAQDKRTTEARVGAAQ